MNNVDTNTRTSRNNVGVDVLSKRNIEGINDLIINLDHELYEVRLRALKCLLRKLDYKIICAESLSQRIDLLSRLTEWLKSESQDNSSKDCQNNTKKIVNDFDESEAIPLVVDLLYRLAQHESFRRLAVNEKIDSLLTKLRLQVGGDLRALIDRLLNLISTSVGNFDINLNECPDNSDLGTGNTSTRDRPLSKSAINPSIHEDFNNVNYDDEICLTNNKFIQESTKTATIIESADMDRVEWDPKDLMKWTKQCQFGISKIILGSADRKLLSSTVESLLSKSNEVVFMTICFVRDTLLNDFPAEIFVQESSLSLSLLEVACQVWDDIRIETVAVQTLLKLSVQLRQRFVLMNSSEFYQFQPLQPQKFSVGYNSGSNLSSQGMENGDTDYFISNIVQILKGISRAVLFQCEGIQLWILLENFSFALLKCSSCFPLDSKSLATDLQDILLDLAHCYGKNADSINTPALVLGMCSILSCLHKTNDSFIVAKDVRRVIKKLACCPRLFHHWAEVYNHYTHYAFPFEATLEPATKHMQLVCKGLEEICNVLDLSEEVDMTSETFQFAKESMPYLIFIEKETLTTRFVERTFALCTNPTYNNLIPSSDERISVILQLMAHPNDEVRRIVFNLLSNLTKSYFGPGRSSTKSHQEVVALSIILHKEFLKQVSNFAIKDSVADVQHCAEEIILYIMKCKAVVGKELWSNVLTQLKHFTCILETQADTQTVIGKAVLNFCNPLSNDYGLNEHELLCSNLRLLYSCNMRVKEEASDRLMKLLSATETGSTTFRYASYSNYTLSSIFSIGRNLDLAQISINGGKDKSFQTGNLLKYLDVCREEDLESNVRRSALSQVAMFLEDFRFHEAFIRQDGIKLIVEMILKIASEKDYKYSFDMWPPAVQILKLIAIRSGPSRKMLFEDTDLLINLTCGLFSLRADDRFRLDTVHLMTLILFHPFLRISDDGKKCFFPQILLNRCKIPLAAESYLHVSAHVPVVKTCDGDDKQNKSFSKYPMENIFKSWWTLGRSQDSDNNSANNESNDKQMTRKRKSEKKMKVLSTNVPKRNIEILLYAVQNATDHKSVVVAIDDLWEYLFPLILNIRADCDLMDFLCRDAPWRDSFYRFLSVEPTCDEDEELLIKVLTLCTFLLGAVQESSLVTSWIIPLCLEKGCACLRLLIENGSKEDDYNSGTTTPSVFRSLMDFYHVMISKHESKVSENVTELFVALSQILHNSSKDGYPSAAILHPVLQNLAVLLTYPGIMESLKKNNQLAFVILYEVSDSIVSIQENGGSYKDSFKNYGVLYYASLSMLHLIGIVSAQNKEANWECIGKCIGVVSSLWVHEDPRTRAAGFQIAQILSSYTNGVSVLFSSLESPSIIWIASYNSLMDLEETSVVKHRAAGVLLNLISSWNGILESGALNESFNLPQWNVAQDITNILSNICWESQLSSIFCDPNVIQGGPRSAERSSTGSHMITPKVLSAVSKLIVAICSSNMEAFHPEPFHRDISSFGLCPLLFRICGSHQLSTNMELTWWLDCCLALSCVVEAIITLSQFDKSVAVVLIGDKRNLGQLVQLLVVEKPANFQNEKCVDILSSLWINIFSLLSILCSDAGQNFEDLERNIWAQKDTIFLRLVDWLKHGALAKCRQVALNFTSGFLTMLLSKLSETDNSDQGFHPVLCSEWKDSGTSYGTALCTSLRIVLENSVNMEEKLLSLNALSALLSLSGSAKKYAMETKLVTELVGSLHKFGMKYNNSSDVQYGKKNYSQWYDETANVLTLLSVMLHGCVEAKEAALNCCLADTIHKMLKWWTYVPDRSLLYLFIETLLNFTEEFPAASQSMILTSSLVGVGPKKVATPQSLLLEIINILQAELDIFDQNPNIKTIDIILSLLKNSSFVLECRTIITKSGLPHFMNKLHVQDMKKWGPKQHHVKAQFLSFVAQLSVHSDMQTFFAKMPECTEVLILLVNIEQPPTSSLALRILRNLTFNPGNRPRFIRDNSLMSAISSRLQESDNLEEIESAALGLWALIANSEKGKLLAKRASCPGILANTIMRVRKLEQCSNDVASEKQNFSSILNLLGNVSELLVGSQNVPLA